MKKIIKIMVVTTLVGISMATYVFAGYGNHFFKNNVNYVDANGDGVCDNYGNKVCPKNGMGRKWGLMNK